MAEERLRDRLRDRGEKGALFQRIATQRTTLKLSSLSPTVEYLERIFFLKIFEKVRKLYNDS
jgi:hypothetical protein